ncbi:MAG: recombinase RecA [Planctomycetes bacterium]|nr:recombinase RecA [Planctomycetota bacterium]
MSTPRLQTGLPALDALLGGGPLPGRLTVVMGATGIGKTQLGLAFAHAGRRQEGEAGILFDMTSRGDSQGHREYTRRLFDWELSDFEVDAAPAASAVWERSLARRDYCHIFRQSGRRVTLSDLDADARRKWNIELARKLQATIRFFYGNFIHGVRRVVIDGVEPVERASDSFQLATFEHVYHQILQKDAEWVARDLFRENFRVQAAEVERQTYDPAAIGCLLLYTSHEVLLDELIERPIESGDLLSNANTVILMGKVRRGERLGRALCVVKHRGSACEERIVPFEIGERGLVLDQS